MNIHKKSIERLALLTVATLMLSILLMSGAMVVKTAAAGETYRLECYYTLYDDHGEPLTGKVVSELEAGAAIDMDGIHAQMISRIKTEFPDLTEALESHPVKLQTCTGLPADGLMPATDLVMRVEYAIEPFTVTWMVDGVAVPATVAYGKVPVFPNGVPTKTADAQYTYAFSGWNTEPVAAYGDATYTARFERTVNEYTVTWDVDGTKTTVKVAYGTVPTYDGTPTKAADAQYTYTFKGWNTEVVAVTGDVIYIAQFDAVPVEVPTETTDAPETDTAEPETDTTAPVTDEETPAVTEPAVTEPDGTEPSTHAGTTVPGVTDPSTETDSGESGLTGSWWWILIPVAMITIVIVVVILLRRKNGPDDVSATAPTGGDDAANAEDASAVHEEADVGSVPETAKGSAAPLFIPLGEEIPEKEEVPAEIETVEKVSVEVVDALMTDKVAEMLLEKSDEPGGNGKQGIINVGVISAAFRPGDVVDLAVLRERGLVDVNVGRLKVLASGTLDKPLTVKADSFSVQAIKMITITGGHAVKLNGGQ